MRLIGVCAVVAVIAFVAGEKWAVGNEPLLVKRNELLQSAKESQDRTRLVIEEFSKLVKETDWCDNDETR